jgi:hypothetical protein
LSGAADLTEQGDISSVVTLPWRRIEQLEVSSLPLDKRAILAFFRRLPKAPSEMTVEWIKTLYWNEQFDVWMDDGQVAHRPTHFVLICDLGKPKA